MTSMTRRRFFRLISAGLLASQLPVLSGCRQFQPRPFRTGDPVKAPTGCAELRRRDRQGDC